MSWPVLVGKKVLIVEDETELRELLAETLELEGLVVTQAASGSQAFDLLQNGASFDVIVSDIRMAGGDGISLLKRIRLMSPLVPLFVFVSGNAKATRDSLRALGAYEYLTKPYRMQDLLNAISRGLEDIETIMKRNPTPGVRRHFRYHVNIPASLRLSDQDLYSGLTINNISLGGVMLVGKGTFPDVGSEVNLSFDGKRYGTGVVSCRCLVRWADDDCAGLEFVKNEQSPIDNALEEIISRADPSI